MNDDLFADDVADKYRSRVDVASFVEYFLATELSKNVRIASFRRLFAIGHASFLWAYACRSSKLPPQREPSNIM